MAKKLHWTQTPEGRAKMAELGRNRVREAKRTIKPARKNSDATITIKGKDVLRALAAVLAAAHKDDLNVVVEYKR